MNERERHHEERAQQPAPAAPGDGDNLDTLQRQAAEFHSAGDAAIARALSNDSVNFLRANRQHGGQ